jgi:hypothetical protein
LETVACYRYQIAQIPFFSLKTSQIKVVDITVCVFYIVNVVLIVWISCGEFGLHADEFLQLKGKHTGQDYAHLASFNTVVLDSFITLSVSIVNFVKN